VIETNKVGAQTIAELIIQLGRAAHGYPEGLSPAQWNALRYVSRANRFSRTVSAFADFHGTTRGTASQTVKALLAQGYLSRQRSQRDGRSSRLELTENGRLLLSSDPCMALIRAASTLPRTTRAHLSAGLGRLLGHMAYEEGKRLFGVCGPCSHLEALKCLSEGEPRFECALFGEPLEEAELEMICANFLPRNKAAVRRSRNAASISEASL
jgi:DNA-binding MarR family transcriptional regulator